MNDVYSFWRAFVLIIFILMFIGCVYIVHDNGTLIIEKTLEYNGGINNDKKTNKSNEDKI